MAANRCPKAFWDFALEYIIRIRQFLVRIIADEKSPIKMITGETPDISEFMDFDFYQYVKYRNAAPD
jgi:hypothetical protein